MSTEPTQGEASARDRLAALPPERRAAIDELLRRRGVTLASAAVERRVPALLPCPRDHDLPLSFDQQRVWFLHRLDPRGAAFNLQLRMVVDAGVEVLERALNAVVARHEVLRTCYPMGARAPLQRIEPPAWTVLAAVDLTTLADDAVTEAALPRLNAEREQPFDLAHGPVWRALALRLAHGRTGLCMTIHHIATDGWSIDRLIAELRELCEADVEGREPHLATLPIQYADYAVWQRDWLQGEVLAEELGYWRERLAGMPQVLDLHPDLPRPPVQTSRGAAISIDLPGDLCDGLRGLAQRHQATLFMMLLALFKCLLARNTGQADVVVGTPVAGRARPELEHVQGLFLNSLVLRTDLGGDPTFAQVLARVRDTVSGAVAHQDVPFEKLVAELLPQRDLSRNPLFQALFTKPIIERYADGLNRAPAGDAPVALAEGHADFDLGLWFEDYGGAATLAWHYNADLFLPATIERLAAQYLTLAHAAVADAARPFEQVDLLSRAEREQLEQQWRLTQAPLPSEPVCRMFEAQVRRTPQALALEFDAQSLSYAELNAHANRLARHLRAAGAGRESRVAICLERGVEMVVAVLAVLKSGAAYVPLDPNYPRQRLDDMLDDSGAALVLSRDSLLSAYEAGSARRISVDGQAGAIAAHSGDDLDDAPALADLAYMIYTSGSTGRPKGVQIEHLALANFLQSMATRPGCSADDVLVAVTTLSFDIAGLELLLPLIVGARVVLAGSDTVADGPALARLLQSSGATLVQATPATWRLLLAAGWRGGPRLKALCGGEALPRELAQRLLPCCRELWNMYGPTETTIWSAACRVHHGSGPVPIDGAIANTRLYLLDRHRRPVPPGVVADLYIGGAGVARGYWQRDELTAERFVADPFSAAPSARMYFTGDSARRLTDGSVEFLGRSDGQIKLRGFRVELGEIEAVLARAPGIAQAVVALREDRPGDPRIVAYVVPGDAATVTVGSLREAAAQALPAHMLPSAWVFLHALPLTLNGKIDRQALPPPQSAAPPAEQAEPRSGVEQRIAAIWCDVLGVEHVGRHDNFFDVGGHSLLIVLVQEALRAAFGIELPVVELFEHPTIDALARRLSAATASPSATDTAAQRGQRLGVQRRSQRRRVDVDPATAGDIAVIGLDGRFPGARDLEQFWALLSEGREGITFFDEAELLGAGHDAALVRHPDYVKAKGVAPEVDLFDAAFFGYAPADAVAMDPQQRLFLQHAWSALEHAGVDPERHAGPIGVYASTSLNSYSLQEALADGDAGHLFHNDKDYLATRVAYKLNLRGPSFTIQSGCSSSLVALAEACEALLAQRCDLALAGGVSVGVPLATGHLYQQGGVGSRDGHCRAFDADASGCVSGDGAGVVVLERLDDALAAGHTIHAVVKGVAVNNDGAAKVGFTAPSVAGQAEVITAALAVAGVDADSIGYVETHGTGTVLGDPIEMAALTQAFRAGSARRQFCAIGSVKTNIGHLDAAAGIAGFIKAVLCLQHRQLPASLNFQAPNPKIDFDTSPFYVNTALADWPAPADRPRRAGVSSFGIGGTNVHVVLEEAPEPLPDDVAGDAQLIVLSAKTETALESITQRLAGFLTSHPGTSLADAAFTLQVGRRMFGHRRVAIGADAADAVHVLGGGDAARLSSGTIDVEAAEVVFMFSGQGAQYPNMTRGLYLAEEVFRQEVDLCARLLEPHLGLDLRTLLYPGARSVDEAAERITRTLYAQPALFVVEYALARLWMNWGIEPQAMIGHSIGEYVAACLADVIALEDALVVVALRGRLMQEQAPGAMLSVALGVDEVAPLLVGQLHVAAVNSTSMCTLSGRPDEVDALERSLVAAGHGCRRLQTSHAFHSSMMDSVVEPLANALRRVRLNAPRRRYISNLTGDWISTEEATDPDYWGRHVVATVQFAAGLDVLLKHRRIMIEVGPGNTLCTFVRQHATPGRGVLALPSVRHPRQNLGDREFLYGALGRLWIAGKTVDWMRLHAARPRRLIALPTYPFEGKRFWLTAAARSVRRVTAAGPLAKRPDLAQWRYLPAWTSSFPLPAEGAGTTGVARDWIVFLRPGDLGARLAERLQAAGGRVIRVLEGDRFRARGTADYVLDPTDPVGYVKLLDALRSAALQPVRIVHAWALADPARQGVESALDAGFYSVLYLVQALAGRTTQTPLRIDIVTECAQAVTGDEPVRAASSAVLGLAKVIPQELPAVICNCIDVDLAGLGPDDQERLQQSVLGELAGPGGEPVVALRHRRRWLQRFEPAAPDRSTAQPRRLRDQGVYLVTGGLGRVGMALAEHLALTRQARLVLVGRSAFPARAEWRDWLASHAELDPTSLNVRRLQAMEAAGAEVMVAAADVADSVAMRALAHAIAQRFGPVHGVIHAAGTLAGESIAPIGKLTRAECELQFRPKIRGLLVLKEVFDAPALDFLFAVSSLSSVLGGLGFAAYAAANQFMDAQCHCECSQDRRHWLSVNWDAWLYHEAPAAAPRTGSLAALALTSTEGTQVFDEVLQLGLLPQVVVSTADLDRRIEQARNRDSTPARSAGTPVVETAHERPALAAGYVAPRSPTERAIAEVWQELLGIDSIGVYDNFFDLGGHSLLAIRAAARLREKFGVSLSLERFLELGTIDQVAWQTLGQLAASLEGQTTAVPPAAPTIAAQAVTPSSAAAPTMPQLEPFYFGSAARPLFALIRRAPTPRGVGVVLCPPHAHEYIRCHRALRELGHRLALSGFDVLSFDYYGTGDSGGEYEQGTLPGWQGDTHAAIDALKDRLGLDAVCVIGLRLGGTLAALVSRRRTDIRALALWDPIVRGTDIRDEFVEIGALQALDPAQQQDIRQSDVLAFALTTALTADIGAVDLCAAMSAQPPVMLVLETGQDGPGRCLADLARAQGARADYRRVDEARVWMREPYEAVAPLATMALLVSWLDEVAI